jgi:hypothetical protein
MTNANWLPSTLVSRHNTASQTNCPPYQLLSGWLRKKFVDVSIVLPAWRQHLIRWESRESTACRAASVLYRLVIDGEGLVRKTVVQIDLRIERLHTRRPKRRIRPLSRGKLRAFNGVDAIF